jgi:L-amino acid N-acyltransferase YncA
MASEKAHENRLRRSAERQGYRLIKARVRDPLARDYGWHIRQGRRKVAHFRDLADAERWILDPASRAEAS